MAEIAESVPEGIPQDVWDAALGTYSMLLPDGDIALVGFEAIARAILAERERCAAVAKAMLVYADTTSAADEAIPAAIMDPNHWLAKNPELATSIRQGSPK